MSDPQLTEMMQDPSNVAKAKIVSDLLRLGVGMGAVGVGARSLMGLAEFPRRQFAPPPKFPRRQSQIKIPVPVLDKEAKVQVPSFSDRPLEFLGAHGAKALGLLKDKAGPAWGGMREVMMSHRPDATLTNTPWGLPAAVAVGGAGLYGGYKLTDKLLGKQQTAEDEDELTKAKARYERAMLGNYKLAAAGETTDEPEPFAGLDELCDQVKQANWFTETVGQKLTDAGNSGPGGAYLGGNLALGLLTAAGTGALAYNKAKGSGPEQILDEAVRRREEMLAATNPMPIEAVPAPYRVSRRQYQDVQQRLNRLAARDLRGLPGADKAANMGVAAAGALGRLNARQAALWRAQQIQMGNKPDDGKSNEGPQQPQLPTMAGARTRTG